MLLCSGSRITHSFVFRFFHSFLQPGDYSAEISHNPKIRNAEYWSGLAFVNCDHGIGIFHSGDMLYCSRNPTCQIKLRADSLSRLSNLPLFIHPAGIHRRPRGRYFPIQKFRKLPELAKIFLISNSASAAYQAFCRGYVGRGFRLFYNF